MKFVDDDDDDGDDVGSAVVIECVGLVEILSVFIVLLRVLKLRL